MLRVRASKIVFTQPGPGADVIGAFSAPSSEGRGDVTNRQSQVQRKLRKQMRGENDRREASRCRKIWSPGLSKGGQIAKIRPSDGCRRSTATPGWAMWYDFEEFGVYLGKVE